ncbi:MarR family winged helix-turn-helix transcriptional regulator [Nocardiopsis deserti]|uniref:MarR family winged helix-turn-helix transcriptional regulator n=1 Tax=Nocardiopsis deserti TaxID=2605988 RepID=UPI001680C1A5|nr:hypothetical protein [Nocardiopsis deserti]
MPQTSLGQYECVGDGPSQRPVDRCAVEREGLIAREPDPEDRRATLLRLTADSRARMRRLHEAQNQLAEELLLPLRSGDRVELHRMLTLLRDAATHEGAPLAGRPEEASD